MKRLCVFCGSQPGIDPRFLAGARELGRVLAASGIELVYGGASVGLMGAIADTVVQHGGRAIGVIPEALQRKELAHSRLTQLHVVRSMHERKALMAELSDAFVALPGGIGTFEELFEAWTWGQLGDHQKPCGLLNIAGFYDGLIGFLDQVTAAGFLRPQHRSMLIVAEAPEPLLAELQAYEPPREAKWIRNEER